MVRLGYRGQAAVGREGVKVKAATPPPRDLIAGSMAIRLLSTPNSHLGSKRYNTPRPKWHPLDPEAKPRGGDGVGVQTVFKEPKAALLTFHRHNNRKADNHKEGEREKRAKAGG